MPRPKAEGRIDAEREIVRAGIRVDHAVSRRVGPALIDFVERPFEPHQRWRGLLFVGPARNGRSWIVSRWLSELTATYRRPIAAQMPTDIAGDRLLRAVADAGRDSPLSSAGREVRRLALRGMSEAPAVVFDGADHLALLRKPRLLRLLTKLKSIGEEQRLPMIIVANSRLLEAITSDSDWEGRFEVLQVPR